MAVARSRGSEAEPLNLIPIMNLVTILIPFLLMAAQFVSYGVIECVAPAIGTEPTEAPEAPLNLLVEVKRDGVRIVGDDPEIEGGLWVPVVDGALDARRVRAVLGAVKDRRPHEQTVTMVAEAGVTYADLVEAMDTTREDPEAGGRPAEGCRGRCLFPAVVVAGGRANDED